MKLSHLSHYMFGNQSSQFDWQDFYLNQVQSLPDGPLKRFYQAGAPDLETPLEQVPMVALDLETTGLNSEKDSIVSVGTVDCTSQKVQVGTAKYWMVKPDSPLLPESITIHEITHSDVAKAPAIESYFEEMLEALAGKVVIVHCAAIERQFLYQAAKRLYDQDFFFPILDTMDLEKRVLEQRPLFPRLFGKKISIRLDACRQRYHLPRYKAHHALTDAFSSAELLQAQISHHFDHQDPLSLYCV